MRIYDRDYRKVTTEEKLQYEKIKAAEVEGMPVGKKNLYRDYPEAIKHYLSLFPNNHIFLSDVKVSCDMQTINERFENLIHDTRSTERDVTRFINHDPKAYYIICSILSTGGFVFGHHDTYIFPEFQLGKDYRVDYLLIGGGSGGYEFVFVELEKPNGRVTVVSGHPGQVTRSGTNQINDWKRWIESNFVVLRSFFEQEKREDVTLPEEFCKLDTTRMHYVVVSGTRVDYKDTTYLNRRREIKESNVIFLHYDNLFDASQRLINQNTF